MDNNNNNIKVLFVVNEYNIYSSLRDCFFKNNITLTVARNGMEGLDHFRNKYFNLIVIDLSMPYKDGETLAKIIKAKKPNKPILLMTSKKSNLQGFNSHNYITKPINSNELFQKINYLINTKKDEEVYVKKNELTEYKIGDFSLDIKNRMLLRNNKKYLKLTPKEIKLLSLLIEHKNKLLLRETALRRIWRFNNQFTARSMDVYIAKLRKIFLDETKISITNVHGTGFILNEKEMIENL